MQCAGSLALEKRAEASLHVVLTQLGQVSAMSLLAL